MAKNCAANPHATQTVPFRWKVRSAVELTPTQYSPMRARVALFLCGRWISGRTVSIETIAMRLGFIFNEIDLGKADFARHAQQLVREFTSLIGQGPFLVRRLIGCRLRIVCLKGTFPRHAGGISTNLPLRTRCVGCVSRSEIAAAVPNIHSSKWNGQSPWFFFRRAQCAHLFISNPSTTHQRRR